MAATQADLDAATAAINAMHTQVAATLSEIAALKASANLDSTALVAATAQLTTDTSSLASA